VLGRGPVYFSAGAYNVDDRTTMKAYTGDGHQPSVVAGTGWGVAKAPFLMKRSLRQPLLVRGGRPDGAGLLGFTGSAGRHPFNAMQFPAKRYNFRVGAFKGLGGPTWATASGCYALQVDGKTFSEVIVFRVAVVS
jgi:hypothetical protein